MKKFILISSLIATLTVSGFLFATYQSKDDYVVLYSHENDGFPHNQETNEQSYKIAVIPKQVDIPYFNAVELGAKEAAADLGIELLFVGPPIVSEEMQIELIDELIDQEIDLIAVSAIDPIMLSTVLERAQQQGIKVITWDSDTYYSSRSFFINMVDPETLGRHLMDTMAWTLDEEGEFAIITGSSNSANLSEWLKWIEIQHQEYYENMTLLEIVPTDDNPIVAYETAVRLIEDYPNLKGIIGNSSVGPPAAAQAVRDLDKIGEISVVGLSSPMEMRSYLLDGSAQMTTLWSPKKLGYLTVSLAKQLLDGEIPYDLQNVPNVGRIRYSGDSVIMGVPIDFTKENVDQYDF